LSDPITQAKELRALALPQLSNRKADMERILASGPTSKNDYSLLVSVLAFALAEVSIFEAEQKLPPHGQS